MRGRELASARRREDGSHAAFPNSTARARSRRRSRSRHRGDQVLRGVAVPADHLGAGAAGDSCPIDRRRAAGYADALIGTTRASTGARQPAGRHDVRARPIRSLPRGRSTPFADEYVSENLRLKVESLEKSAEWLTGEVDTPGQAGRSRASSRSQRYREKQDAGSLDSSQNIVVARLTQLNEALTRARTDRIQKESLWKQIQAAGQDVDSISSVMLSNPSVQNAARRRSNQLQQERSRVTERYGEKHPELPEGHDAAGQRRAAAQVGDSEGGPERARPSTNRPSHRSATCSSS